MTHPLTPREKVEPFERYPALASWIAKMASVGSGLSLGEWMTFVGALNAAIVQAEQRTALASGSGDHAELALMANAALEIYSDDVLVVGGTRRIHADNIILYVKNGVDALLAEIAALRGELDHIRSLHNRATDRSRHWEIASINAEIRATEAERKLAEADRLLERIANDPTWDGPSSARLYFLSKEAERG